MSTLWTNEYSFKFKSLLVKSAFPSVMQLNGNLSALLKCGIWQLLLKRAVKLYDLMSDQRVDRESGRYIDSIGI